VSTNDFDAEQGAAGGVATNVTISLAPTIAGVAYENNQIRTLPR